MVVALKTTLAAKLSSERHRYFIARERELRSFGEALASTNCSLLFVRGPSGVGKTSLLQEYQRIASERGHAVRYVDADELARHRPEALLAPLTRSLDPSPGRSQATRPVLLIDGYERLGEGEPWLLDRLGHELPGDALLVVASRKGLPQRLLLDRAWAGLTKQIEVPPWTEDEAREFLRLQGVPESVQEGVQAVAHGYPLALAIAADVYRNEPGGIFGPEQVERVQSNLSRVLSLEAASRAQQLALDVCAVSQNTTVELLEHALRSTASDGAGNAHQLFEWLAQRLFVDRVGSNVRPQLLARQALLARLRREQKYDALLWPIREFWVNQIGSASAPEGGMRALYFLDRDVPFVATTQVESDERASLYAARRADQAQVVDLVRRLDGEEAAELCRAHLRAEPDAFEISRSGGNVNRLLHTTRLNNASDVKLSDRDPVARLAKQFMREHPLEKNACVVLVRWLMSEEGYQSPSPPVIPVISRAAQIIMATPRVSYALGVYRDPDDWQELWDAAGSKRSLIGRFTLDKRSYSLMAFSYLEGSLRDLLLDAGRPPSATARQTASHSEDEQQRKIKQRVADLARSTKLTAREVEILQLLCLGVTPENIAQQLQIRPRTVKFHQENVLRKTGSATRVELFRRLI